MENSEGRKSGQMWESMYCSIFEQITAIKILDM